MGSVSTQRLMEGYYGFCIHSKTNGGLLWALYPPKTNGGLFWAVYPLKD